MRHSDIVTSTPCECPQRGNFLPVIFASHDKRPRLLKSKSAFGSQWIDILLPWVLEKFTPSRSWKTALETFSIVLNISFISRDKNGTWGGSEAGPRSCK